MYYVFLSSGVSRPFGILKLTFTTLWAFSAENKLMIFFLFFPENRIWHFMQIKETICMKCQILFSGKIRKIFQSVVCLKFYPECLALNSVQFYVLYICVMFYCPHFFFFFFLHFEFKWSILVCLQTLSFLSFSLFLSKVYNPVQLIMIW